MAVLVLPLLLSASGVSSTGLFIREPYVTPLPPTPTPTPAFIFHEPPKWTYCSCVDYAKYLTGHFDGVTTFGAASKIKPNVEVPEIGDWVLTYEDNPDDDIAPGHVAVVMGFTASGSLELEEANYKPCKKSTRTLSPESKLIRGYFRPELSTN